MRIVFRLLGSVFVVTAVVGTGCGKGGKDPVLARIGSQEITASDYRAAYLKMRDQDRPVLGTFEERKKFLEDLINKEVMEQAALERYPELSLRQQWRLKRFTDKELSQRVKRLLIRDPIEITEEMKDQIYANMSRERHFKAMMIGDSAAAEYVREALRRGESFTELVQAHSVHWVGPQLDGDIGWRQAGTFPYEIDTAAWKAEVGDTLGPYHYPLGSYLLVVLDERPFPVDKTRDEVDRQLEMRILEPLYMNRQKAVLESLRTAADPYYPPEAKAVLLEKYHWEPPPDADPQFARLDADRLTPTFTAAEESLITVQFENAPDWTIGEFSERLEWYPPGLWPTGETEDQLIDVLDMLTRDYLYIKAAYDLGVADSPEFKEAIEEMRREMRVNYFYYTDIVGGYEPDQASIDKYFEENRDRYQAPPSYKVALFGSQNQELIHRLGADWKAGMSYPDLRAKYEPQDPELQTIGETAWVYEGEDQNRDSIVATLKTGGVTDPIEEDGVFLVVKLIARRGTRLLNYDEVKDQVDEDAKTFFTDEKLNAFLSVRKDSLGTQVEEKTLRDLDLSELPPPGGAGERSGV